MNKHIGSSFDDSLIEESLLLECEVVARKRILYWLLQPEIIKVIIQEKIDDSKY